MKIDELIERLEADATDVAYYYNALEMRDDILKAAETIRVLNAVPAADVVEVVRCKDCNHNRGVATDMWGNPAVQCDYEIDYKPLDWYCAAGEKE